MEYSRDGSKHVTDEKINVISHLAASIFAVLGGGLLVSGAISRGDVWAMASLSIYAVSLITLFVLSTIHHGINGSPRTNSVLRTLDYTAVFFLIAGTVTPLCLIGPRTTAAYVILAAVWAVAATGITLRASISRLPKFYTNTMYICLGWLPVVFFILEPDRLGALNTLLLAIGGLFYTIGFVVYASEKPNFIPGRFGFHELWHILVVLAAAFQFLAIYIYALG